VIQPSVGSSTAIKDVVNQLFNAISRVAPHPAAFPLPGDLNFFVYRPVALVLSRQDHRMGARFKQAGNGPKAGWRQSSCCFP
jgi:hypothetical protein